MQPMSSLLTILNYEAFTTVITFKYAYELPESMLHDSFREYVQ